MVCIETVDLCFTQTGLSTQPKEVDNGQTQMRCWEAAHEVHKAGDTYPSPVEESQVKALTHKFVTHYDLVTEDAEYDLEDWWNQMDVHTEYPTIHDIRVSLETLRHPNYISPETDLHSCPPMVNNEQLHMMYPECFNDIGEFKNYEHHFKLEGNAKPVVYLVIKVTLALRDKLEKELQNVVDQGIIAPVGDGESNCFNSLIIREKPVGRLCICLDPKDLKRSSRGNTTHCHLFIRALLDFMEPHYSPSWMLHRITGTFHSPKNHKP